MQAIRKLVGVVFTAITMILILILIAPAISATQADTTATILDEIQKAIEEKGAKWTAGETSVSGLSIEAKMRLCGRAQNVTAPEDVRIIKMPRGIPIPYGTFDWRNKDGQNWMTSVKDQNPCGTCWCFAVVGAVEAAINIYNDDPTIDFDMSEQHVLSCDLVRQPTCNGGFGSWALSTIKNVGAPSETCFPYSGNCYPNCPGKGVPCNDCPDWEAEAWKITDFAKVTPPTTTAYKWALQEYGPLDVPMYAPHDFFFYTGGIYEPTWTSAEWEERFLGYANHEVLLMGFDDIREAWIVKNSWGAWWGNDGYAYIAYGNIEKWDDTYAVLGTISLGPTQPDLVITGKWLCWPDNCTICYNVMNIGDGTAPSCHNTTLYIDGVEVAHDHVPVDLAPGESYTGCFNGYEWTYTPPRDNITVCADNNENLDELDENNNCLTNIWICGDANCDGNVTMSDVRKLFNRYLDPNYPLDLPWAADVNCDGKVTMSDVRKVFNRYLDPGYELECCCGCGGR